MNEQERISWLKARRRGLGGSDIGAILGISHFKTGLDIWESKTATGEPIPQPENMAMRIGHAWEQLVADEYTRETGRRVVKHNKMEFDPQIHAIADLDRLVIPEGEKIAAFQGKIRTNRALECKTAGFNWDGQVPEEYRAQVMWYMGLCPTIEAIDIAVIYKTSSTMEIYTIERNQETIDAMQAIGKDWWERYVLTNTPPPPETENECKRLWSRSNGKAIDATQEMQDIASRMAEAKERETAAKKDAEALRKELMIALGENEILLGPNGRPIVTWKNASDKRITDWEAIAKELGASQDMIDGHTTTKAGSRTFLLKI